jgi:nitroreductase
MAVNRRTVLGGLAVGAAAVGGGAWWLSSGGLLQLESAGPDGPWRAWRGSAAQPVRNLLRAAILASNAHNAQPWLFRIGDDRIEVYADPKRQAGDLDPYLRELHLGLGCALENMALAASANGLAMEVQYTSGRLGPQMPAGPSAGPAAIVTLGRQAVPTAPLFDQIPHRHTNVGPYDPDKTVPTEATDALSKLIESEYATVIWLREPDRRAGFGALTVQATRTILKHPSLVSVWQSWLRPGDTAADRRDGMPIDVAMKDAAADWVSDTQMQVRTAPLIGVLAMDDPYNVAAVLRGGRAWQRIHLEATRRGLAVQPLNQILWRMEYEENLTAQSVSAPAVYELLNAGNFRPALFFRIGYAKQGARRTPRRPLDDVVLKDG